MGKDVGAVMFDLPHTGALVATVVVAAALVWLARRPALEARPRRVAIPLALVILTNELAWHGYQVSTGTWDLASSLPLHLCDAAIFVSVAALLTQRQMPFELAYFWGLGGSVQALLTPGITDVFPTYEFFRYFVSHSGIVVAVAYLVFARRMRPGPRSVRRTIGISLIYMVVVGGIDQLLTANYMFLCRKPDTPSLMDYLGPWPWYVASLVGVGAAFVGLLYLPYYLLDRWRKGTAGP